MIADAAVVLFLVSGALALHRLVVGPSLADRVIALDVALVAVMGAVAVRAATNDGPTYLPILAAIAIVGFTATVALSRFIERTGRP